MTIKLKTKEGLDFSFDTVDELMEFKNRMDASESLGKDAYGEDIYTGDYVTGLEGNGYAFTDDKVVMEVLGAGESPLFENVNILVKIDGDPTRYNVNSSYFIKLSDNLDEANAKFNEIKGEEEFELLPVGTKVRILSPSCCGDLSAGDVGTITETDIGCSIGLVYSVRVRGGMDGYGWVGRDDVVVVED